MTTPTDPAITDLESRNAAPRQDSQDPSIFGQTPWQTVGPYFHYGLPWKGGADLVGRSDMGARPDLMPPEHFLLSDSNVSGTPEGEVIALAGCVYDADGKPIEDARIEIWQANAKGRYASPDDDRTEVALDRHFVGFGRASADKAGVFRFRTLRPGRVPGPGNSLQAPHIALSVFGRGLLKRLPTRLYFADGEGNETDPILALVPESRRHSLIAQRKPDGTWWLDINLAGESETVFFDL